MALSRMGDFIELVDLRNNEGKYAEESLKGISINKVLTPTKADTSNLNLRTYKILKHNWFTYCTVTSRNGNKISLAYNDGDDCLVSSINPVFKVKDESKILPRYLFSVRKRISALFQAQDILPRQPQTSDCLPCRLPSMFLCRLHCSHR